MNLTPVFISALTAGLITVIGWFVTYLLSKQREYETRRQEAALCYLQRQIEEFYGPLLGLIQQRLFIYEVVKQRLPLTEDGDLDYARFSPSDSEIIHYLWDTSLLHINSKIATLLLTKIYLLETDDIPDSFKDFLQYDSYVQSLYGL